MRATFLLLVAPTVLGPFAGHAVAELVRFDIAGTLTNRTGLDPLPPNTPSIGSPFTGSFVFDTAAPNTGSSTQGVYHNTVPPSAISLQVGGWEWSASSQSPTTIIVWNDRTASGGGTEDSYSVGHSRLDFLSPDEPNPMRGEYWLFRWELDGPNNIFNSTNLPQQAFSLAPWTTNRWSISQWGTPPAPLLELSGSVGSFSSVVVPEPSSVLLTGGSLGVFLMLVFCKPRCDGAHMPRHAVKWTFC
jgi:hypothetical protein